MDKDTMVCLNDELAERIVELSSYSSVHSDEYTKAVDNVIKLSKMQLEQEKEEIEFESYEYKRKAERICNVTDVVFKSLDVGLRTAGIIVPVAVYIIGMSKGYEFEKEGVITSRTFRDHLNWFRPMNFIKK